MFIGQVETYERPLHKCTASGIKGIFGCFANWYSIGGPFGGSISLTVCFPEYARVVYCENIGFDKIQMPR